MAMTLVSTVTVGSGGASSVDFTNIPQTGKDLLLLYSIRSTRAALDDSVELRLNLVSNVYSWRLLTGNGSAASSGNSSNQAAAYIDTISAANTTANTFSNASLYISNYTSNANKSLSVDQVSENNATTAWQTIWAGLFGNTGAITQMRISTLNANLAQYSTASLYIIS